MRPGGRIAVLAASSPSDASRISTAAANLAARGFEIVLAGNLASAKGYLAGDDDRRASELERFLQDRSFDAFLFSRGGYGAMRILDRIDWTSFARNPRPVVGYSDVTAIHQALAAVGVGSFHGPMLNTDFFIGLSPDREEWFFRALSGDAPLVHSFEPSQIVSPGATSGILFGGCLSLTSALIGTPYDFWIDDGVWFWEDVSEPTYSIDRMLTRLRLSGRLSRLRGVMIGKLKDCGGSDPAALDALIDEFFADQQIPVVRELPFGHHGDNLLLPIGARVELDTVGRFIRFPDPLVREAAE